MFVFSILLANDKDSTSTLINDESQCLQFQIGSNFNLGSFQGSTISYKKHISNSRAYRVGISISGKIEDRIDFDNSDTDSLDFRQITDYDNLGIELTGQYLKYLKHKYSYFYYGYGPKVIYSRAYQKYYSEDYITGDWERSSDLRKYYGYSIQVGLELVAGVEVFLTNSISIHGEYSEDISYKRTWSKQPYTGNDYRTININEYSLDFGGVKFGCSFYF